MRVGLVGDEAVGKSCFMRFWAEEQFSDLYISTIGIDFNTRTVSVDGINLKIQVWDTAGQERFIRITESFYKTFTGIALFYDCTNQESFNWIVSRVHRIKNLLTAEAVMVLVSSKCDRTDKIVPTEEGEALANELGIHFFECSGKNGVNVEETLYCIAKQVKDKGLCRQLESSRVRISNERSSSRIKRCWR